jgi:hypothetical protein
VTIGFSVTTQSFTTTFAQTITPGMTYNFVVFSRNAVGMSTSSAQIAILAAIVPGAPSTPVTYNDGTNVYLKWDPPST